MFSLTANIARVLVPFVLFNPFTSFFHLKQKEGRKEASVPKHEVKFELLDYDEPMEVHKRAQSKFLGISTGVGTSVYKGKSELSRPEPAYLAWRIECDDEVKFDEYTVYFSENSDMSDAREYVTSDEEIKIYNVLLGETYYWYVESEYDGETYKSDVSSFETEPDAPRNLFIDGVTNARDMGGWRCDGGKVKQGMIFRTGQIHDDCGAIITEDGMKTMLDELGIKTEIDLRNDITRTDFGVLGEKVKYVVLPMSFSDNMMLDGVHAGYIRDFFKILADEDNYPVFFHCVIGTDRTGVCAFLLNGLLGVAEEDLYRDYRFSNFGFIGGERDGHNIAHDIELLDAYDGETLSDRIASYLISIGVTEEEISLIKDILIEK